MSKIRRSTGLTRFLVATALGLFPIGFPLLTPSLCLAQGYGGQDPGDLDIPNPFGPFPGDFDTMPRRGTRAKTARKKLQSATKDTAKKAETTAKTKKGAANTGQLTFSQDIAPILVANCVGCHSGEGAGLRRGKLDLTTYEKLKKGSQKRTDDPAIVVAGKPEESHLVLRIKGEESPRMPQGGNNRMSAEAIAKIEQWVKEGAKLDAGIDPKKPIKSYAASPEQMARNQIARLPEGERDKKAEAVGLERWKQANPKLKPDIARGEHFLMFSNLASDRATNTIKVMETQYLQLRKLMGSASTDWAEKVSLYVFSSRKDFIEFVRTVETREVEGDAHASAKLSIAQPYLAVVDPAGGKKEEPASGKRKGRLRKGGGGAEVEADSGGADRTLAGILTEALGTGALAASGNPPRWLALGVGSYMASKVDKIESRSHYYTQLRQTAFANFDQGWKTRANEALGGGDQITADGVHSIGFALVEAMMSGMQQGFPAFVNGMLHGGGKLDEVLQTVYGGTRDEFLDGTGDWVASHYGRLQ
jgi:mono/diheme cytochrome c family protein